MKAPAAAACMLPYSILREYHNKQSQITHNQGVAVVYKLHALKEFVIVIWLLQACNFLSMRKAVCASCRSIPTIYSIASMQARHLESRYFLHGQGQDLLPVLLPLPRRGRHRRSHSTLPRRPPLLSHTAATAPYSSSLNHCAGLRSATQSKKKNLKSCHSVAGYTQLHTYILQVKTKFWQLHKYFDIQDVWQ